MDCEIGIVGLETGLLTAEVVGLMGRLQVVVRLSDVGL